MIIAIHRCGNTDRAGEVRLRKTPMRLQNRRDDEEEELGRVPGTEVTVTRMAIVRLRKTRHVDVRDLEAAMASHRAHCDRDGRPRAAEHANRSSVPHKRFVRVFAASSSRRRNTNGSRKAEATIRRRRTKCQMVELLLWTKCSRRHRQPERKIHTHIYMYPSVSIFLLLKTQTHPLYIPPPPTHTHTTTMRHIHTG